jgi:hypothetical protein
MQHCYIQMKTEPRGYSPFPGEMAYYTLKCSKCGKNVSPHGSIGEIQMHAPVTMLDHWHMISLKDWDMIQPKDDIDDDGIDSVLLLFSSYDRLLQSRNLLKDAWNSRSGHGVEGSIQNKCKNHDYDRIQIMCNSHDYGAGHRFCEAVRVDMENLKEKSVAGTTSSILALITVLFVDVVEAVNIHNTLIDSDVPQDPWPSVT